MSYYIYIYIYMRTYTLSYAMLCYATIYLLWHALLARAVSGLPAENRSAPRQRAQHLYYYYYYYY